MTAETSPDLLPPAAGKREPVAVLMSRFPSITETFILREMIEMERQGQPVRVVPMLRESPEVVHEAARPWVPRALYTPWISPSIVAANAQMFVRKPLRYLSLLARLVAGTVGKPGTLARTLAIFPKSVWLARRLEAEGIRHLHPHFATHPTTMALIIASLSGIRFSFTVHAHDIQVDRSLLRWKLREARFVRSISDYNRRFLESLYPEAKGKIHVVHVGIEPAIYEESARKHRERKSEVPLILCVAAHKPYKGLPYLIEACRILRHRKVPFRCVIVGQGPMRPELEKLVASHGLQSQVELALPRPQEEITQLMAESTLFVLPSIVASDGQMEGIPVALMEAMASGRAVVSTTISGIPELVEDGVSGLLVPPGDAAALAEAIRSLLAAPDRAAEMGRKGEEKIRRQFSLPGCVSELIALFDRDAGREAAREAPR